MVNRYPLRFPEPADPDSAAPDFTEGATAEPRPLNR